MVTRVIFFYSTFAGDRAGGLGQGAHCSLILEPTETRVQLA